MPHQTGSIYRVFIVVEISLIHRIVDFYGELWFQVGSGQEKGECTTLTTIKK